VVLVPSPDPHAAPGMVVPTAKTTLLVTQLEKQITGRGPCRDLQLRIGIYGTPPSNAPLSAGLAQLKSQEEESCPGSDLTKVSSQNKTPTLHVTKTPTAAVPNRRSVTREGRTGWEDRYIDTHRDRRRVRFGGNGSGVTCCNFIIT